MIKPRLNTFDLSMIVVSLVIGVGIFRTPAVVAEKAGEPWVFFAAWILGGLVSICGALTFAEIGARCALPGGFYQLFSVSYNPVLAFMINWMTVLTYAASIAGVSMVGVEYLASLVVPGKELTWGTMVAASVVLMGVFAGINYMGIKTGASAQNLLSGLKILLILVLCSALFWAAPAAASGTGATLVGNTSVMGALGASLISVFFTYGGYQQTVNFGGDVIDAKRNTARAIFIGMGIVILLYLCINVAYVKALGFEHLAGSKLLAADLARSFLGDSGAAFTSLAIFVSVAGFINASFLSIPRMYYAMAEDGVLPPIFKKINPNTQSQEFALLFLFGIAVASLLALGAFDKIVNYVMTIDCLGLSLAGASIFVFRKRNPVHDGFNAPLYPLTPIIYIGVLLFVLLTIFYTSPWEGFGGMALFALGWPLFYLFRSIIPQKTNPES